MSLNRDNDVNVSNNCLKIIKNHRMCLRKIGTPFVVTHITKRLEYGILMPENILIIDKNTIELRKLREVLTREGFGVMTATDHATAKQICEQIPVKFILGEAESLGFGKK